MSNTALGEIVRMHAVREANLVIWYVGDDLDRERCSHEDAEGRCERPAPWYVGVRWGEPDDEGHWWRYGDYCATHWMAEFARWSDRIAPEEWPE